MFNFEIFARLAMQEYRKVKEQYPDYPYDINEVLFVFDTFFQCFQYYTKNTHPFIRRELIRKYIELMPFEDDRVWRSISDIDPHYYLSIIEQYFNTPFRDCDYRIAHFFSGDIRVMRMMELQRMENDTDFEIPQYV